jgi:hypothetical protein
MKNPEDAMQGQNIGIQWAWVLDVVFGGIIALGYQKLEEALQVSAKVSAREFLKHLFSACSFFAFVIYDVGVYHLLIQKYPYTVSPWSAVRYVLDLVMAFCLLVILMRGLSVHAEQFILDILLAISCWHLGAMSWHFAAAEEYDKMVPPASAFLPHICFVGLYWLLLLLYCLVYSRLRGCKFADLLTKETVCSPKFLYVLCPSIFLVSIFRSVQILAIYKVVH